MVKRMLPETLVPQKLSVVAMTTIVLPFDSLSPNRSFWLVDLIGGQLTLAFSETDAGGYGDDWEYF